MLSDPIKEFILPDQACLRLTLAQVESATNNFDEALIIGRGGFGPVYKSLSNFNSSVNEVAIKRLHSTSSQGANEFEAEVKLLSTLRHGYLVPLIGYCSEGNEMVLAYEFMPNGTLEDHLHKGDTELSWLQRLKICIGAARGLDYLHTGTSTEHGVIHRDVKTSNILLDSNLDAKICDFGLAKLGTINQTQTHVSTLVKGTFGYMDPCYFYSGKLTRKSDVYAFGVVLLEVLSGRHAVDPTLDEDQWSLAIWAQNHYKEGKVYEIIDHRLTEQISKKCLKEFVRIALHCLHDQPKQRPTMAEAVVKLEYILSRERERAGSRVDDGRFINKIRYIFTGKADMMSTHARGGTSEIRAENIKKSMIPEIRTFTYDELVQATNNCNHKEFSTYSTKSSYKGWVDELTYTPSMAGVGLAIYVRTRNIDINSLDLESEEFSHPNLAELIGYFLDGRKLSCVYKLNTSLDELLFNGTPKTSLSWVARLKIALGAARGMSFLHRKGHPAYSQFQTNCILVDTDYNARLWNFEVEDNSWAFRLWDTHYTDPEWQRYPEDKLDGLVDRSLDLKVKLEIYSFGVVLLEILTGRVFHPERLPWELNYKEYFLGVILDAQLKDHNHRPKDAAMLARLVSNCLQWRLVARPSMKEISQTLNKCYMHQNDS